MQLEYSIENLIRKNEGCSRRAQRGLSERGSFFLIRFSSCMKGSRKENEYCYNLPVEHLITIVTVQTMPLPCSNII